MSFKGVFFRLSLEYVIIGNATPTKTLFFFGFLLDLHPKQPGNLYSFKTWCGLLKTAPGHGISNRTDS